MPSQGVRSVLRVMVCSPCLRRSALVAAVAPAIARCSLRHHSLLSLLGASEDRLLRAVGVQDPRGLLRGLRMPALTDSVPTALCRHDAGYPRALRQLPNAPAVLYATCTAERLRELLAPASPRVAIVGGRGLTPYAQQITRAMTEGLARAGVTVVGGVNEGPEGIAHEGALAGAGRSIAVMACSPDLSHLTRQDSLHQRILAAGAAVSEFPPGFFQPQRWSFIASRRIVPALADVVVIVEAGGFTHSALSTKIAVELGRDIAVVPGRVTDPSGERILRLLQDGAHPVASAEHVLEVLNGAGLRGPALHDPAPHELADGAGVPGPAIHDPALHGVAA